MIKHEPTAPTKFLKTGTCKTLSGESTLTYQIGCKSDSTILEVAVHIIASYTG